MKRTSALKHKLHDDIYEYSYKDSSRSSYADDSSSLRATRKLSVGSEPDSISDGSKKIRKKRNTYQKISDDIRVMLLEAVQNGETLKAAAKRHKINYSSAKSILHTYRKEGRILKKSAQERTIKKKSNSNSECGGAPSRSKKSAKKENIQPDEEVPTLLLNERAKSEPLHLHLKNVSEKGAMISPRNGLVDASFSLNRTHSSQQPNQKNTEEFTGMHQSHSYHGNDLTVKPYSDMLHNSADHYDHADRYNFRHKHGQPDHYITNFETSYPEHNFFRKDSHDYGNFLNFPNNYHHSYDSNMSWNYRPMAHNDYLTSTHDLIQRVSNTQITDDKAHGSGIEYGHYGDNNSSAYAIKNFLDSQNLVKETTMGYSDSHNTKMDFLN